MILKYFYDKTLAQASYMVGCAVNGEAVVIDPARDITPYLQAAKADGLKIRHVTETHIHADYTSGSRELAHHTGARLYLSDMGDADWKYAFAESDDATLLHDGAQWMVGNVRIEALHTPGHTPEHLSFMITDTAGADAPMGVFTGDFLFVGDVGRPDLLELAAGFAGTQEAGARQQFHSVQRFRQLPDYLQIWPGHGAGSACGKALGAVPSTTLGYEKRFNPAFQFGDEAAFVAWLLDGQPEVPRYFARMKQVNKAGPALLRDVAPPERMTAAQMQAVLQDGAQVIDFRSIPAFAAEHLPGTINIPINGGSFPTYIGWFVDYTRPLYFIVPSEEALERALNGLRAVGVDDTPGYALPEVVAGPVETLSLITADEAAQRVQHDHALILDVRGKSEYDSFRIRGAKHIPLGHLPDALDELPRDRQIIVHCSSGYRAQIAASLLRRHGFEDVHNLFDKESKWRKALPTEQA